MKKITLFILLFLFTLTDCFSQVSINNDGSEPDAAAMLEIKSASKGLLPPRLTTTQRDQISSPPAGLMIFNIDCDEFQYYKATGWTTMGSHGLIAPPAVIAGSTNLCAQVTGVTYSASTVPDATSYTWTVPAGATLLSGQGTSAIVVNFGNTGGSVCVTAKNACYSSLPTCVAVNVSPSMAAGVSISTGAATVCQGTTAIFTSTAVNGGSAPQFQWKKNNVDIPGATNVIYSYVPVNNDIISCRMVSNGLCVMVPTVYSNYLTMTVNNSVPGAPTEGIHVSAPNEITWTWNAISNAVGYKWSTENDFATAADMGTATSKAESGLSCNTLYTRYVWAYNGCGNSTPVALTASTYIGPVASVTMAASANPVCNGIPVIFTATPVNGSSTPLFQWRKNGTNVTGATNATYIYNPANGDSLRCQMTSGATCAQNNPAWSNMVTMTVNFVPDAPAEGTHVAALTEITWSWNAVSNAIGYKWNTSNDYATATDMGTATTKTETGLTCDAACTRYVWAYNNCGNSVVTTMNQSTLVCPFICGTTVLTVNHVTTGGVAPVNKTTAYGTVTNIPGEPAKCWITQNLGATHQATVVGDATEASAGWYWQFNRKQGYKHDGVILTPGWTITSISEASDWQTSNDPCKLELSTQWRLPTYTEWYNVDNTGGWTNWNGPWSSGLKLHAAGYLFSSNGSLYSRGSLGYYWSSSQYSSGTGWHHYFESSGSFMLANGKATGFSVRCIRE
jgi:hypothetical protein